MNDNEPGNHDEGFRNLLNEWRTDAPLPPRFQETVWRRIQRTEQASVPVAHSPWSAITHWIGSMLSRPALAASYVVVLLAIGATAGWTQAQQVTERVKSELGERYVRVLDPFQTPRQ